jgi:hypothetical protein
MKTVGTSSALMASARVESKSIQSNTNPSGEVFLGAKISAVFSRYPDASAMKGQCAVMNCPEVSRQKTRAAARQTSGPAGSCLSRSSK